MVCHANAIQMHEDLRGGQFAFIVFIPKINVILCQILPDQILIINEING